LYIRKKSIGLSEFEYKFEEGKLKNNKIIICDVGGQRNERKVFFSYYKKII
jgi:hypothetical protein